MGTNKKESPVRNDRQRRADKKDPPEKKPSAKSKKRYRQLIFRDWCKGCGICSAFCPKNVIGRNDSGFPVVERPDECIGCRFCELHCPDFAITIKEETPEPETN